MSEMNIGECIDRLFEIRNAKGELNRAKRALDDEKDEIEAHLLGKMKELGVESTKSKIASATISKSIVPHVDDWDAFYEYIVYTNSPFLLERRPSVTAYRDLLQAGEVIPGVSPFTEVSISLRKL